jgi:hypothetical protein
MYCLCLCLTAQQIEAARVLIELNAVVDIKSNFGNTPLQLVEDPVEKEVLRIKINSYKINK